MSPADREALRELALDVAREGAALVRERRSRPVEVADVKTSDIDVVTEADRACEELLRSRLLAARPGDRFLGEEGGESDADADGADGDAVRWIVDPIDGTVNFYYDLGLYAVCVAAEAPVEEVEGVEGVEGADGEREVVAGVVVDASSGVEYDAVLGGGARRDGRSIGVRGPAPLAERLINTGFSYDRTVRLRQAEAWTRLLPRVRDLRRRGSAALDICLVADGRADGYVEEGVNLWDHAAAGLVAREAGATTSLQPGVGGLTLMVCAPSHGYRELLEAVVEAGFAAE